MKFTDLIQFFKKFSIKTNILVIAFLIFGISFPILLNNSSFGENNSKTKTINDFALNKVTSSLTPHGPISINGSAGFLSCGCTTGSGTKLDPFIIQNYYISNSTTNGVFINNTNAFFTIQNVFVNQSINGIYLSFSRNGIITNDTVFNSTQNGFYLFSSNNISLTNDFSYGNVNGNGFYLDSSKNNSL